MPHWQHADPRHVSEAVYHTEVIKANCGSLLLLSVLSLTLLSYLFLAFNILILFIIRLLTSYLLQTFNTVILFYYMIRNAFKMDRERELSTTSYLVVVSDLAGFH